MSIEKEEIERNARRYGVEDDVKVRRQKDELDTLERQATVPNRPAAAGSGPAAFYASVPTASFPDAYVPPAARFAQDVDRSVAKQDMAAGVPNIDDESTWPSQWGKQPALPPAARRVSGVMNLDNPPPPPLTANLDQPVDGGVPTASFPRDDPWGSLGPKGQAQAYQMMGFGNEENLPRDPAAAYAQMPVEAYGEGYGQQPVYEPSVPAWATRREASAMQQARPGVPAQQQRPRFSAFHLNEGISDASGAYADAVRGAR